MSAQIGMILICVVIEFALQKFHGATFDITQIITYEIWLFGSIIAVAVLILWLYDKRQEQKKIQELTSYAHRTREVIPSVGRVLQKVELLSEHMEKADEILGELRDICGADMKKTGQEVAAIKTFHSTGSVVLNEQLERYLEEAAREGFCLDIIVRAPAQELLESGQIERYALLQVIGDLYRNAYKIIKKRKDGGRILICFGYNVEGDYEISIYDNGEPFPEYVIEHLGERGVTDGGTGHGMADILEALKRCEASFVLRQEENQMRMYTKGISVVFDGKGRVELY